MVFADQPAELHGDVAVVVDFAVVVAVVVVAAAAVDVGVDFVVGRIGKVTTKGAGLFSANSTAAIRCDGLRLRIIGIGYYH